MQSLVKKKILLVEIQESSMEVPDMFMMVSVCNSYSSVTVDSVRTHRLWIEEFLHFPLVLYTSFFSGQQYNYLVYSAYK